MGQVASTGTIDGPLAPGVFETLYGTYTITQADLDTDGRRDRS